jgi:hypothetical protein
MTPRRVARLVLLLAGLAAAGGDAAAERPRETAIDEVVNSIEEYGDIQIERRTAEIEADAGSRDGVRSAVEQGTGWISLGIAIVRDGKAMRESYQALTAADADCIDVSAFGAPSLPASCEDVSEECGACYEDALGRLDRQRLNLERLRCVYTTSKDHIDNMIAFGDTASGIHGVTGLAWQNEKIKILKAVDEMNAAYDKKYAEMMTGLKDVLEQLGECEAEHFGERDWYARFGYLYYGFMADRYRR